MRAVCLVRHLIREKNRRAADCDVFAVLCNIIDVTAAE